MPDITTIIRRWSDKGMMQKNDSNDSNEMCRIHVREINISQQSISFIPLYISISIMLPSIQRIVQTREIIWYVTRIYRFSWNHSATRFYRCNQNTTRIGWWCLIKVRPIFMWHWGILLSFRSIYYRNSASTQRKYQIRLSYVTASSYGYVIFFIPACSNLRWEIPYVKKYF